MLCAKCGKTIASDAKLCNHCGTVVGAVAQRAGSAFTPPTFTRPVPSGGASGAMLGASTTSPVSGGHAGGRVPTLLVRVKGILLHPGAEWRVIAGDPTSARDIYLGYVAPLAAIGIIAAFIGSTVIGVAIGPVTVRTGIYPSLAAAVLHLALTLAGVYVLARFVGRVVPMPGGRKDPLNSLRVVAYSLTPAWVAAIVMIVPALGDVLVLAALYGGYLVYRGLRVLLQCTPFNAFAAAVAVAALAFVLHLVMVPAAGFVLGLVGAGAATVAPGAGNGARIAGATGAIVAKILFESTPEDRARAGQSVVSLPGIALDFVKGSQAAKEEGDPFDRAVRALALLAAGGKKVEPVDADALAALLPATVAGMPKGPMLASGETQHGLQGTIARAIYENESTKITLEVGDMGEFAGAARALARFDPAVEKTFDWGYRRSYWADGNLCARGTLSQRSHRHRRHDRRRAFHDRRARLGGGACATARSHSRRRRRQARATCELAAPETSSSISLATCSPSGPARRRGLCSDSMRSRAGLSDICR